MRIRSNVHNRAFTLIEIMIVVVIISILASVSILGTVSIQRSARDDARKSQATVIAEALEKYYQKNNEYPSVASITEADVSGVQSKLGIADTSVLLFPGANNESETSIVRSNPSPSRLQYAAGTSDTNASLQCQEDVSGYCDSFKLAYVNELNGSTVEIKSRHSDGAANIGDAGMVTVGPPSAPSVSATPSASAVALKWEASSGSQPVTYSVSYKKSSDGTYTAFGSCTAISATTCTVSGLAGTTTYNFKVTATNSDGTADGVATATTTTTATPPSAPVVTASPSTTSVQLTWGASSGTQPITYTVTFKKNSDSTYSSASGCGGISGTSCTVSGLIADTAYNFKVTATNSGGSANGLVNAVTTLPSIPATPVITNGNSGGTANSYTWSWNAVTCTTGTPLYEFLFWTYANDANAQSVSTYSTSITFDTSSQGQIYYGRVRARCVVGSVYSGYSGYSAYPSYSRYITAWVQARGGGARIRLSSNYANGIEAAAKVTGYSGTCPSGAIPQIRARLAYTPGYTNASSDPSDEDWSGWYAWANFTSGGYERYNGAVNGSKSEYSFEMWCYNTTTHLSSNGDIKANSYSDMYGNLLVKEVSPGKKWGRNCSGGAGTPYFSSSAYCSLVTLANATD